MKVKVVKAVCYSYISYYTAWMKVNYPLIFHKTMLNGNLDDLGTFMDLAREDNINIYPPHVNYSIFTTSIQDENSLRIGFNTINGVGDKAVDSIIEARPFISVNDYLERNNSKGTNKKVVEALIDAGAFDGLGVKVDIAYITEDKIKSLGMDMKDGLIYLNRKQLRKWFDLYIEAGNNKSIPQYEILFSKIKRKYIDQYNMTPEKDNPNVVVIPENILSSIELTVDDGVKTRKRAKGLLKEAMEMMKGTSDIFTKPFIKHDAEIANIKINNLELYLDEINKNGFSFIEHPLTKYSKKITVFKDAKDGDMCIEAGIILGMTERKTSTGKTYYWMMIRTPFETIRVTVWANTFKKYKSIIKQFNLIAIKGKKGYGGMDIVDLKQLK